MTDAELVAKTRDTLMEFNNKEGHDVCWWYPELLAALNELYGLKSKSDPKLPPFEEFQEGCKRFQADLYRIRT